MFMTRLMLVSLTALALPLPATAQVIRNVTRTRAERCNPERARGIRPRG